MKKNNEFKIFKIVKIFHFYKRLKVLGHFGLKIGFLAQNNVGLCPPDLKRPTGGDFSSIQVNFDESCIFAVLPDGSLASGSKDKAVRMWNTKDCAQCFDLWVQKGGRKMVVRPHKR